MKIFKSTDRLKVKIGDVTLYISPLTFEQKAEVQGLMMKATDGDSVSGLAGARLAVKYSVKKVEGIESFEGDDYELSLEGGGLTDECCDDLVNSEISDKLLITCCSLLTGMKNKIIDPMTKLELKGVKILKNSKRVQKK